MNKQRNDPIIENIPQVLRDRTQWICWKYYTTPSGIPTKRPIGVRRRSDTNWAKPRNWTTFELALQAYQKNLKFDGIAYVFSKNDPFAGIDLDDCLDKNGDFIWGKDIVDAFNTYSEVSPSGEGVKLIFEGEKPSWSDCVVKGQGPDGAGQLEIYDRARCFAITGRRLTSLPSEILNRQKQLDELCAKFWTAKPTQLPQAIPSPPKKTNENLLERMQDCYKAIVNMRIADKGDGSHRLFCACCRCVEYDLPDDAALRVIAKYNRHYPFPTAWSSNAVIKRLRSAEIKVERGKADKRSAKCKPSLLSVGQLLRDHPELRPPVIHGLLRAGETMNVIAPPKYGKSWLVTDLAMAVTTGRRWLDAFETESGNVLILDNELHSETSANRIPKVADARGIGLSEIADKLFVDNLRGRLLDVNSLQAYFESLRKGFFKIIIMDAFYRFLPKDSDENSNGNMTDIYNRLDWYAAMLGCSFVLVHHASKGNQSGKSVTDVGAGAGSQARATDTHLILRQHQEDGCVVVDAAVRSWQPLEPLCLRWTFPVWNIDDALDPADLRPERPRKKSEAKTKSESEPQTDSTRWTPERFVESFLGSDPLATKTILALAQQSGLSRRMADQFLQLAQDKKMIHRWTFGANRPVKFATLPQPTLIGAET